jgi:hypothetical protein
LSPSSRATVEAHPLLVDASFVEHGFGTSLVVGAELRVERRGHGHETDEVVRVAPLEVRDERRLDLAEAVRLVAGVGGVD